MAERIQKIINGCLEGRRSAQEALYNAFASKMYGVCLRYASNSEEAQDMMQEGFIKVFAKLKQYKGNGSFEGWVRRVIVNTALEKLRSKTFTESIEENPNAYGTESNQDFISDITSQDLMKMVQSLSPKYRVVFNMYAIEGYSHKEIGELLKISEGTSKSNLSRARAILQEKVNKYYQTTQKIG